MESLVEGSAYRRVADPVPPNHRLYMGPRTDFSKIISQEQARLVHTHFSDYDVAAWLAVRLAKLGGEYPSSCGTSTPSL